MNDYVGARDTRIKCAALLLRNSVAEHSAGKAGRMFLLGTLWAFLLMPSAVIVNIWFGLAVCGLGFTFAILGMVMLLVADRAQGTVLAASFARVDQTRPDLIATMRRYREDGVQEKWDADPF